jgi:hypothetical protein
MSNIPQNIFTVVFMFLIFCMIGSLFTGKFITRAVSIHKKNDNFMFWISWITAAIVILWQFRGLTKFW